MSGSGPTYFQRSAIAPAGMVRTRDWPAPAVQRVHMDGGGCRHGLECGGVDSVAGVHR